MKKLLGIIALLIISSCSTSSDGNGNSTTTVVPLAPTGLIGTVASATQINLSWTDNSTNEIGFKIDRKVGSGNWVTDYGIVNSADIINYSDTSVSAGIIYTYRVCSFNSVGKSLTYSNEVTLTPTVVTVLPTLTTTYASSITQTAASSGGTITNDGGAVITARGICWSISPNPTIALATKTTNGAGIGEFTSNITGLTANTTYYVRAYATNSIGTAYGNEINFTTLQNSTGINIAGPNITDIDGNTYQSVTNCGLTFTKQNLNVSKYSDGTPIPQVTDPTQWANLTTGAWCYYNNTTSNGTTYGKLYNWYAVAGIYNSASATNPALRKKLSPNGWHVPTVEEWIQLIDCLGGTIVAGGKMKATGTSLWLSPNTGANNSSGFTGLPGGMRIIGLVNGNANGRFDYIGASGSFWSSTEGVSTPPNAWHCLLSYYTDGSNADMGVANKLVGYSVRCIRD